MNHNKGFFESVKFGYWQNKSHLLYLLQVLKVCEFY